MDTSNRNTESTLKFNLIMVMVVITAQAMEANIITEVVLDMEDTEVVHTAVTKNFEAAMMDRKMPNTTRPYNSGQKMKIKNEIELPPEVSFNVNNLASFFLAVIFISLHSMKWN